MEQNYSNCEIVKNPSLSDTKVSNPETFNISSLLYETFILILKKWTSFRLALDNNPKILFQYAEETQGKLEIESILELVFDDIFKELQKNHKITKFVTDNIGDMLFDFFEGFFRIDLQDGSEEQVAKCLLKAYNEFVEKKTDYLDRLRVLDKNINPNLNNYNISFPITAEDKLVKNMKKNLNLNDMEIEDNYEDSESEEQEEDEGEQVEQSQQIEISNLEKHQLSNKGNSKKEEVHDEGFVVVKKGKKY
jgi:hypothetical protein